MNAYYFNGRTRFSLFWIAGLTGLPVILTLDVFPDILNLRDEFIPLVSQHGALPGYRDNLVPALSGVIFKGVT